MPQTGRNQTESPDGSMANPHKPCPCCESVCSFLCTELYWIPRSQKTTLCAVAQLTVCDPEAVVYVTNRRCMPENDTPRKNVTLLALRVTPRPTQASVDSYLIAAIVDRCDELAPVLENAHFVPKRYSCRHERCYHNNFSHNSVRFTVHDSVRKLTNFRLESAHKDALLICKWELRFPLHRASDHGLQTQTRRQHDSAS